MLHSRPRGAERFEPRARRFALLAVGTCRRNPVLKFTVNRLLLTANSANDSLRRARTLSDT